MALTRMRIMTTPDLSVGAARVVHDRMVSVFGRQDASLQRPIKWEEASQ